jgi:hypothetical protein
MKWRVEKELAQIDTLQSQMSNTASEAVKKE